MRTGGLLACSLWFSVAACGPPPEVKQPDLPEDAMGTEDKNVDVRRAKEHIEKAVAALRDDKLDVARKELDRAQPFADELKREEIRRVRQSVDEAEADKSIPGIQKLAKAGECEKAVAKAVKVIKARKGTTVPTFVKKGVSSGLLECLLGQLEVDLSIGRELAESKDVKKAMTKADHQAFITKVTDATVKELVGKFEEPIANKEWAAAKKLLDELVERKEAGDNEYNRIMGLIRDGIGKEVKEKIAEGLADKNEASDKLKEVDQLIIVAEWGKKKGSSVGGSKMPDDIRTQRKQLALFSVCAKLKCSLLSSPKESWAYGDVKLKPKLNGRPQKAKPIKTIEHATKIWRLAESSGWVLIARKDPGGASGIEAITAKASGWIKKSGSKTEDTAEMLPPGDSIIGTRVWGPLRKGEKEWEIGKVINIRGKDVAVKRFADGGIETVARSKIRFGTIKKGTKILSRCSHPLHFETAVIDKVVFPRRADPSPPSPASTRAATRRRWCARNSSARYAPSRPGFRRGVESVDKAQRLQGSTQWQSR